MPDFIVLKTLGIAERVEDQNTLWKELCMQMGFHRKGADTDEQTLNRLFCKALAPEAKTDLPSLTPKTVKISKKRWTAAELKALLTESHHTELEPENSEGAVVVVRWQNKNYLLDGRRRINCWLRSGDASSQYVLFVLAL